MTDEPTGQTAINTLWAREFVDELARCGLRHVCISPGSRSTPLVVQFDRHPGIEDVSIIDERSAAFFALGIARATDRPVALVCTSGTAAANWYPAVCEADVAGVPLLLLSADRPPELRDVGSPQSMDQTKLYGDRVRWFHELGRPEAEIDTFEYLRSTADFAWAKARGPKAGPVHLNVPFRKPLDPVKIGATHRDAVPDDFVPPSPKSDNGNDDGAPFSRFSRPLPTLADRDFDELAERLAAARRPLFLCGADRLGRSYADDLVALAAALDAPVLAEPTSGIRYAPAASAIGGGDDFVLATGDLLADSALYDRLGDPDLVVRTGRPPLNWAARRRAAGWNALQIAISPDLDRRDPDRVVDWHITAREKPLFQRLAEAVGDQRDARTARAGIRKKQRLWLETHQQADGALREAMAGEFADGTLDEPRVWWEMTNHLPDGTALFVSNSMPTRDLDVFGLGRVRLSVHCNRGLNGIDGVTSTGLGLAGIHDVATVVVCGDVALRHDLGGLAEAKRLGADVTLVVIDNRGGGIFEMLPIAETEEDSPDTTFRRHFLTAPELNIPAAAEGLGIDVSTPADAPTFRQALATSVESPGIQLISLQTDRRADKKRRTELRRRVLDACDLTRGEIR